MNWNEIQALFAGTKLLELHDYIGDQYPLLKDIYWEPTNDGVGYKIARGIDVNVAVDVIGSATVTPSYGAIGALVAQMLESKTIAYLPMSIATNRNTAADKMSQILKIKTAAVIRYAIAAMLGYKYQAETWTVDTIGFNVEDAEGEKLYCTEIDANGTANVYGLTDVWIIRWDADGALCAFPFFNESGMIQLSEPFPTILGGQSVYAQDIGFYFAPCAVRPTSIVKIKNLNHPLTGSGGKYLTEDLLLEAFGALDVSDGTNVSIVLAKSQFTQFLKTLTNKSNLLTTVTEQTNVGLYNKVIQYNGGTFRPILDIYHSKTES